MYKNSQPPKIQKLLAQTGIGSRREIETWIRAGRIQVNGAISHIGQRVDENSQITFDDQLIWPLKQDASHLPARVWIYHKPVGEICSRKDPENRPTVFDHLPPLLNQRWISIGRLDFNTAGLLLFTTDGELAQRLMHPAQQIERVYQVRVYGQVSAKACQHLLSGVLLEDGPARFSSLQHLRGEGANHWYQVGLNEGRNREVRRLWESQGVVVNRLCRIQFDNIALPKDLKPGQGRFLSKSLQEQLYKRVNLLQ